MELINKTVFLHLLGVTDISLVEWNTYYSVYLNQLKEYKTYSGDTFIWYYLDGKLNIPMLYIESMKVLKIPKKFNILKEDYLNTLENEPLTMDTWNLEMISNEVTLSNSNFIKGINIDKDTYPKGTYDLTTTLCPVYSEHIEIRRRLDRYFGYSIVEAAPKKIKDLLGSSYYEVMNLLQLLKTFFKINNKL